jgi:hypothetical protein
MQKHAREIYFYIDDSGSRDPDRHPKAGEHEPDRFGLGGVLVDANDKDAIDASVDSFKAAWPQIGGAPLRSYDLRNMSGGFRWLSDAHIDTRKEFYAGVTNLITDAQLLVAACVVHRPGYNERYLERYGARRWKLCRTAFHIVVERAAKFAMHRDAKLRVFVERSDKQTEQQFKEYFDGMRQVGHPFDDQTSAKYAPLCAADMRSTLLEFRVKTKQSQLMQLADLTLWPVCQGGYSQDDKSYAALRDHAKLLDAVCTPENTLLGVKYSCFPG